MIEKGLRRLKGRVKKVKIFAFDIETINNNKDFYCGSIVGKDYKFFTWNKKDFIKEITSNQIFRNSSIFATNLMFDFYCLFDILDSLQDFKIIERGGNLILASSYIKYDSKDDNFYKNPENKKDYYKINFYDSWNHIKLSVANMGKILKMPKMEKPKFLGNKAKTKKDKDYIKAYNIQDSYITYKFMEKLQEDYNDLGGNLKATISSTSLDIFRRKYLKDFWKQPKKDDIIASYKAYYGGRTETFKRGCFSKNNYGNIHSYDVNSLYPYCLSKFKYPYINEYSYRKKVLSEDIESFEGFCQIHLKTPKVLDIPLLPVKSDKLLFPLGEIKGYYDFVSIRKALSLGYEITEIGEGLVFENTFNPFKSYINSMYKLRNKFKANNDKREIAVKLAMNSFYGKFGYRYYDKEFLGTLEDYDDNVSMFPTSHKDIYRFIKDEDSNIPSYVFPIFPLYVTSYARSVMFDYFKKVGYDKVFYTDTDCIFTTRKMNTGNELGELKLENKFNELILIKPKFYSGITDDKTIVKVKGLHGAIDSYSKFKDMVKKDDFKATRTHFRKLRSAIGFKDKWVNQTFEQLKEMQLEDNKRIWEKNKFTLKPQDSKPIFI